MNEYAWEEDLSRSRSLGREKISSFELILGWFDSWRMRAGLEHGREAAERFWREELIEGRRESWRREEWAEAFRWYTQWYSFFKNGVAAGVTLVERACGAVQNVGLRRGLSLATRRAYLSWVRRYAAVMGSAKRMMKVEEARRWLQILRKIS